MGSPSKTDHMAVTAKAESGQSCTVTVQWDPLGRHLLHYKGSETVVAELTPEVIEPLTSALSRRGRSVVVARSPGGGACTLLVIGQQGRTTLYFHASTATSAVLDAKGTEKLRAALASLDA